jgi:DNA-binding transcriptional regulator YhcF (GntR family)
MSSTVLATNVAQRALKVLESEGAVTLERGRIQIAKPDVLERMSGASRPTRPRLSGPRP